MNNSLYHWDDEQTVKYEMQELYRAVEQERLLREAGLSGPSLLARATKALQSLLRMRRERAPHQPSVEGESYQAINEQ